MPNPRFLQTAERWKNPSLPKERKPIKKITPEKSKLERDSEGKPKITLNELEKTVVNTPTQEEYTTLMQVYECGGWKWHGGCLPTQYNCWNEDKEETCIEVENEFAYGSKKFNQGQRYEVISTQKFYDMQKITQGNINEINKWFEENA